MSIEFRPDKAVGTIAHNVGSFTTEASKKAGEAFEAVSGAAGNAASAAVGAMGDAASAAGDVFGNVADAASKTVQDAHVAAAAGLGAAQNNVREFMVSRSGKKEENVRNEDGSYILPEPILDDRECVDIEVLTEQYEKLMAPGALAVAKEKVGEIIPTPMKNAVGAAGDKVKDAFNGLTEQELIAGALKVAVEGYAELQKRASNATISKDYVISQVNKGKQSQKIKDVSDIRLLRAYDIASIAAHERPHHLAMAFVEGGATGWAGFPGIPANFALSMLLYFRAVQSLALFYGYDVKDDPTELAIAGDVFASSFQSQGTGVVSSEYVGKVLVYAQSASVQQAAKKGWAAMIEAGGAALAIAQIRALSNKAAEKALDKAGAKALEAGIFEKALTQIGNRLALNTVGRAVPVFGAGFGALFDTAQMNRVLDFADIFYHKRFTLEKAERIQELIDGREVVEAEIEALIEDIASDEVPEDSCIEAIWEEEGPSENEQC